MSDMRMFAQITKVDEAKRLVYGRAVQEMPDRADEIFDYASSKQHFVDWSKSFESDTAGKSLGNLRAMHGKIAAGKLTAIDFNDTDKAIDIAAKVVDDSEWAKVVEGVYTGFSIGGSYVGDKTTEKIGERTIKRYTAKPAEISLVDSPCIPSAKFFDVIKADGALEKRAFKPPEFEVVGTDEQVAEFAKLMQESKVSMADVIEMLKFKGKEKEQMQDEGDGDDEADETTESVDEENHEEAISSHAHDKTAAAMESNKPADHAEAAHAHRAAEAHFDGKDEGQSDHHAGMAAYHEQMASHKFAAAVGVLKAMGKREFSTEERDKAADTGAALPDGSFPIKSVADLKNAVHAYGRAGDKAKAKAHIIARAKALGASSELPSDWGGAPDKAAGGELAKPLIESTSDDARSQNIAAEVRSGKSQEQAAAIAYSVQREAKKKKPKKGMDIDEIVEAMDGMARGLEKGKMPAAQMDRLQAIHDHSASMGADCSAGKADKGELAKGQPTYEELAARLKKLEDQPVPYVTLRAVAKEVRAPEKAVTTLADIPEFPKLEKDDYVFNGDGTVDYTTSYLQKRYKLAAAAAK